MRDDVRGVTIKLPFGEVVWSLIRPLPNNLFITDAHMPVVKFRTSLCFTASIHLESQLSAHPAQEYYDKVNVQLAVPRHVTPDVATLPRLINRSAAKARPQLCVSSPHSVFLPARSYPSELGSNYGAIDDVVTEPFGPISPTLLRDGGGLENLNTEPSSGTKDVGDPINLHIDDRVSFRLVSR
jgi:hypothetical protein